MLDGSTLINKFHSSKSNYVWSLKTKDGLIYIENKDKNKVLELEIRRGRGRGQGQGRGRGRGRWEKDKLIEEDFVEDNPKQLWKKAKPDGDTKGYFFLGSSEDAKKVLTATNASALEITSM